MNKKELIIGGAQLGYNYGSPKYNKKIKKADVKKILLSAKHYGVSRIDTASRYIDSEKDIGFFLLKNKKHKFKIFSKLENIKVKKIKKHILTQRIYKNFSKTLESLNLKKLECISVHNAQDFFFNKKVFLKCFNVLKQKKYIKGFGMSIYTPNELYKTLKIKNISYIQMPMNVLDNRWNIRKIKKIKKKTTKIYVRSIFLRGLLFLDDKYWPNWFKNKIKLKKKLSGLIKKFKKKNIIDLTFSYLNSLDFVDGIIFGFNSIEQFNKIIKHRNSKKLDKTQVKILLKEFKFIDKKILDTRNY